MNAFFVGWNGRSIRPVAGFLGSVCLLTLLAFSGLALALGSAVNDPGGGDFAGDKDLNGVVVAAPYPLLVLEPDATHPNGHAVLLSGGGKRGVQAAAAALDGERARVTGAGFKRGTIDMVVGAELQPDGGPAAAPIVAPLGIWRLTGEICDGKCVSGVMRPGNDLAHKACANICISGGVPPVLVTTAPVEGAGFLLMGDANGHALPDRFRDHTGIPQRMDGSVERVADVLIFRTDIDAAVTP
jgi:hypothetical protein